MLCRYCAEHFTLIVSVNSLQQFYKVGSVASLIFQIRKSRLREDNELLKVIQDVMEELGLTPRSLFLSWWFPYHLAAYPY